MALEMCGTNKWRLKCVDGATGTAAERQGSGQGQWRAGQRNCNGFCTGPLDQRRTLTSRSPFFSSGSSEACEPGVTFAISIPRLLASLNRMPSDPGWVILTETTIRFKAESWPTGLLGTAAWALALSKHRVTGLPADFNTWMT